MPSPSDRTAGATEDAPDGGGEAATATVTPAVAVREVTHRYGRGADAVTALGPLSLDIPAGEFLVLVGPSGSGKSTLLRLIAGFEQASSGEVTVHGRTPEPGRQAGVVFQQPRLFPWRTVGENISLALRYAGVPRAERPARVEELLERVGLAGTAGRRTWQMSGASSSGWPSPGPWPAARTCWCWTSRSPPWTRSPGSGSRRTCGR